MGVLVLSALSLLIWLGLLLAHDRFWTAGEQDAHELELEDWPAVVAVVPARDEADVIARSLASLAKQDYPGDFRIVLVDDGSSDGTAEIARGAGADRLRVLEGSPPPAGWTGKLWAMRGGIASAGEPRYLWLTDADIEHAPDTLRMLVARSEREGLAMHSLMALLRCESVAERALVPAFVFFFQMLYPFRRVNRARSRMAAAAGGCMLVNREKLTAAGGLAEIKSALIDDCALGVLMKGQGPIRLSLTKRSVSIRPYGSWRDIGAMIARSAYAQLRYSPFVLVGTIAGMSLVYVNPALLALFGHGATSLTGWTTLLLMAFAFQPMLRFYRRSPLWGFMLPLIALFYAAATWVSAWNHWRGRGGLWKGRTQAKGQLD